ncbi:hypothetical protein BLNAU_17553 [Blattamonas nauphoetae]|uniref:Uncharacterized protein n=1 Tax=Blattamonas nauphoetae TaxID=2049346 RepID=A0ABQ9X7A6_9EUKA|nr:hypothetical protein BLNAU_17553 [Blattamonas nauphoetae]
MDSTLRTVQFFVNGKAGECYVSGIPESVRIGFSADVMGTSLEIASIIHSTQATPLADKILEIKWTDTQESLYERSKNKSQPIRREAEGSMPALLCRNPEHFKIEGNVITRTAFGCNGLTSPFSTVMLDGVVEKMIKSVTVTILALPETEHSCGVVMIGGMFCLRSAPANPKGLGFWKAFSFGLSSFDGMIHSVDWSRPSIKLCHSPLRVGDQVVLEVNTQSKPDISRFFVNGKAGLNDNADLDQKLKIGFSLAGPGTSIRIDSITELYEPSEDDSDSTDDTTTNESEDIDEALFVSKHDKQSNHPKPEQVKVTAQPSGQKTDSVHRNPTAASSSTSKVPLKPQPLAAKVAARDHPAYEPFFAKLRSGKKTVFLAPEMREKGLNPAALSDPDMLV